MITIYGASDDLVEVEGCIGADEFYTDELSGVCWSADLVAPGGEQMRIKAIYDGCWSFAICQADEAVHLPAWGNGVSQHGRGYSTLLSIDAPEGTRLTNVWPAQQED